MFLLKGLALLLGGASLLTPTTALVVDPSQFNQFLIDSGAALQVLGAKALAKSLLHAGFDPQGGCTLDKIKFRREW